MESPHQLPSEVIKPSTKTLRVYPGFGVTTSMSAIFRNPKHERAILELFSEAGFSIVRGGTHESDNPLEICFGTDDDDEDSLAERKQLGRLSDIPMPDAYIPIDILKSNSPVVAKCPAYDRGELKYLLETHDQKVKFIAWSLIFQRLGRLVNRPDHDIIISRIFNQVSQGQFTDPFIDNGGWLDSWVFEEYIDSPGDYHTSFRVVADAFGNIHYGQVARSDLPKKSQIQSDPPNTDISPLKEVSTGGSSLSLLLTRPDSPFYLASKKIVSNISRGGTPLILNGTPIVSVEDRRLIQQLGIDPDNPQIPPALCAASKAISPAFRNQYPYVGIDFMQRPNGGFVLLEVNKGPGIRPEAIGLPADTPQDQAELAMLRRVITHIPS